MKLRLFVLIFFLLEASFASAYQFKGDIYGEVAAQELNSDSYFNPDNLHQVGDTQYFLRTNLIFKNDFSEHLNGVVNLEGQYYPAYYTLVHPFYDAYSNPSAGRTTYPKERIFLKEAYLDILNPVFITRIGKQYIKWGKGTFFNPSDVINFNRDPLRPKDEAEGNPFIDISIPIQSFFTIEAMTVVNNKKNQSNPQKIEAEDLPFISKLSFSIGSFSGFGFGVFQNNRQPIFGLNLDYAFSLGESSSVTVYAESVYLIKSYRQRINESQTLETMPDKNYQAVVIGTRFQTSFTSLKWLDGLLINFEYYYNNENWSNHEYNNYLNKLYLNKTNELAHFSDLVYFEPYRNSHHYGYASVYLTNFIFQNFTAGNDFVFNIEDYSAIYMPSIAYTLDNTNAEIGLKSILYFGNSRSEFGNSISKFNIIAYTQITF